MNIYATRFGRRTSARHRSLFAPLAPTRAQPPPFRVERTTDGADSARRGFLKAVHLGQAEVAAMALQGAALAASSRTVWRDRLAAVAPRLFGGVLGELAQPLAHFRLGQSAPWVLADGRKAIVERLRCGSAGREHFVEQPEQAVAVHAGGFGEAAQLRIAGQSVQLSRTARDKAKQSGSDSAGTRFRYSTAFATPSPSNSAICRPSSRSLLPPFAFSSRSTPAVLPSAGLDPRP